MNQNDTTEFEPPAGWSVGSNIDTFSHAAGPFYFRDDGKAAGVGFLSQERHRNVEGVVHGGMLMTLADIAMFTIYFHEYGMRRAVTISMTSDFLKPAPIGEFITATGEVVKTGRRMVFVRGLISAAQKDLMHFSGSLAFVDEAARG